MNIDLATQLRSGTRYSHTLAENTAYMKYFLQGIIGREPFRKLLGNLYFVYGTLEAELLRHCNHKIVSWIYFPQLERKANLEVDLTYYYGNNWREKIVLSKAASNYVTHLHKIAYTEPALLVAHSYVRYLGDLSGGQVLKKIIRSALELPKNLGTRFYEFDYFSSMSDVREFKGQYRDALNSLPVEEELAAKIVKEANYAFSLNCAILHSLEADVKAAIGENIFAEILSEKKRGSTERSSAKFSTELVTTE